MPLSKKVLTRLIGAPLLLAALFGLLYWGHRLSLHGQWNWPLTVLLALVAELAAYEFLGFAIARGIRTAPAMTGLALVILFVLWTPVGSAMNGSDAFLLVTILFTLYLLCKSVFRYGSFPPEGAAFSLLGYLYIAPLGLLLFPPVDDARAVIYLLFLLAAGKGSDMAAYCVGKTMGKHTMAPVVSPNKTWEGGIGGAIVGTGAALALLLLTPLRDDYRTVPWPALLFLALLVTIAAQVGDLVKSAFKRWAGVKDSGRLLPEFGGMLDMVDSFLVCAPVAHLATILLQKVFRGS